MKALIADDHAILRTGLKEILAGGFKSIEFGDAGNTQQTLDQLTRKQWDLLVLDISMPGRSGLDVLREARLRWPKLPILVLSSAPEEQLAIRVLKAAVMSAKLGNSEELQALKRLDDQARALERVASGPSFEAFVAGERRQSAPLDGRSVFGWEKDVTMERKRRSVG